MIILGVAFIYGIFLILIISYLNSEKENLLEKLYWSLNKKETQDFEKSKIISIIRKEIDSLSLKKNLYFLFALFFAFTLFSKFKTKRYFITSDGSLIRNVETFWGSKVVQFELEERDGRWFAKSFENGSKWFQIDDEDEDFYEFESESEKGDWFD